MVCQRVTVGGVNAIVCGSRRRVMLCRCSSGKAADLLCDWKVKGKKSGTCDRPLCADCTHSPAPDKDLCPEHKQAWRARCGL